MATVQYFPLDCRVWEKLNHHLEIEFEQKKNRQIYWDDVAIFCYPEEYNRSELIALEASNKKYVEE